MTLLVVPNVKIRSTEEPMRRTVCAMLLAGALAGCGSPLAGVVPQPSQPIVTTSQVILLSPALATAAPPPAADGSDIGACFDGECEISVSRPVKIPLDGRAGFDAVAVEAIRPNSVSFRVDFGDGIVGRSWTSPGGTAAFNSGAGGTRIAVVTINAGTAVIKMSPA